MTINIAKLERMYALEETAGKKFADMSPEEQKKYLAAHPNSKLGGKGKSAAKTPAKAPKAPKRKGDEVYHGKGEGFGKTPPKTTKPKAATKSAKPKEPAKAPAPKEITPPAKEIVPQAVHAPRPKKTKPGDAAKNAGTGFYPKEFDTHVPKGKPSVGDTIKEIFGMKRSSYARLQEMASREVRIDKAFAGLSKEERAAYLKANPHSRFRRA